MFGNRKLAKRSIIGTRVAALRQDGRYYPGFIESQISEAGFVTSAMYIVKYDDGTSREVTVDAICGPQFKQMTDVNLKCGQKVYLTLNGREVSATVFSQDEDSVLISVTHTDGEQREMVKRIDEVRLLESRKSARLADMDTDYSKLADIQLSDPKKRTVSHVIDVPAKSRRERRHLDSALFGSDDENDDDDVDMSDDREHMAAAFALTSLSSSPASPSFPQSLKDKDYLRSPGSFHDYHLSSSAASSGFESGHSERSDRSPPLPSHLSESAPAVIHVRSPTPQDDCLDLEENVKQFYDDDTEQSKENKQGLRTIYKCTWRGCGSVASTTADITKHVRKAHFGRDSDEELSDQEEDFYYNEIEIDQVTRQFAEMNTSSPPNLGNTEPLPPISMGIFDHDYQRKEHKHPTHVLASSVPSTGVIISQGGSLPISIPDGQIKRSLSWQNGSPAAGSVTSSPVRFARTSSQVRLQQHQAQSPKSHMFVSPPKASGMHRKPRSEVRKCRKVYGMENRDSWCTQCKWKKACTRFLD